METEERALQQRFKLLFEDLEKRVVADLEAGRPNSVILDKDFLERLKIYKEKVDKWGDEIGS